MARIRALIVDDDLRLVENMKNRLGREIGWDVEWEAAIEVDEGSGSWPRRLAVRLVIADLCCREDVPDLDDPRGLDLIKDARLPFSAHASSGHQHRARISARPHGGRQALRVPIMSSGAASSAPQSTVHSPAAIAAEIRGHLLDNGTVSTCEVAANPLDPGIQGLLQQVGEATVARLYAKVLEAGGHQTDRIELRFLTPGASGASICTVTAQVDGIGRMSHILKLSQVKGLLTREAERGRRAAEVLPPPLLVQHRA